jgi:hypothetical protein
MTRLARILAYLTGAIVCLSYALDAPLWHGAVMMGAVMTPILATVLYDYLRLRAAGLRGVE